MRLDVFKPLTMKSINPSCEKSICENIIGVGWDVAVGDLNIDGCLITDEILEEIINEWFIKKKLIKKIRYLQ